MEIDEVRKEIEEWCDSRPAQSRVYTIYTGTGGMDLISEHIDYSLGFKRIYIGQKVPRILRKIKGIVFKKSIVKQKGWYRLVTK